MQWFYRMKIVSSTIVLFFVYKEVICFKNDVSFSLKSEYDGKVCTSEDITFDLKGLSKIPCTELCVSIPSCYGVAYIQMDGSCTGCTRPLDTYSSLVDKPGASFYSVTGTFPGACSSNPCLNGGTCVTGLRMYMCTCATGWTGNNCEQVKVLVDCGLPPAMANVVLLESLTSTLEGTQVLFQCVPCSYYDLNKLSAITCQPDGQWTTPNCVYGPDTGYLATGAAIPANAIGCLSALGTTCGKPNDVVVSGMYINGTTASPACICNPKFCCSLCCFDARC